ncbi:MAG: chemotaxis protein CheV [Comamonas sp. SCN 65-56]|uniref:chemotaxis protein n=1 Tax=Comamonas sp. SCN 65-56 TaxID=1660095 RepID=UPI00086E1F8F|nr:chemotaxis protein [Comamonas sp. SCN 65-56]ODS93841.1 MAG: chemotaxis protein CheV [Comamonas sp. SCN 65-56]
MAKPQSEVDERTNLVGSNKFEMLMFRLGKDNALGQSELFGINVFKIREIMAMPQITPVVGADKLSLGVVNLRGQVIPVFDLPTIVGCKPETGLNILLVTEYARSVQAFAVESVEDIARLNWSQVIPAEASGNAKSMVTSFARLDPDANGKQQLAQVLDVEAIVQMVTPESDRHKVEGKKLGSKLQMRGDAIVLAADDSFVARSLLEQELKALSASYEIVKSGKEAWERLNALFEVAEEEGKSIFDKVGLVLTDLEMPEMDGFTLTRNIKQDPRFARLPVLIHSSLSGTTNEDLVRKVGANGYVAKFEATELANAIRGAVASTAPA